MVDIPISLVRDEIAQSQPTIFGAEPTQTDGKFSDPIALDFDLIRDIPFPGGADGETIDFSKDSHFDWTNRNILDPIIQQMGGSPYSEYYNNSTNKGEAAQRYFQYYTDVAPPGKMNAAARSFFQALIRDVPMVAGAASGAKLGARVPFAQPAPTIGGAVVGGLAGSELGNFLLDAGGEAGILERRPVYPTDRVMSVGGDSVGGTAVFIAGAPSMLAKRGAESTAGFLLNQHFQKLPVIGRTGKGYQVAEEFLRRMGQTARGERGKVAQKAFYAAETGIAGAAGAGAMGAEVLAPGSEGARFTGEVLVGSLYPQGIILKNLPSITDAVGRKTVSRFGTDAREADVGQRLYDIISKYIEFDFPENATPEMIAEARTAAMGNLIEELQTNPAKLDQLAREIGSDENAPAMTPAMITGQPILRDLQKMVATASTDSRVNQVVDQVTKNSLTFVENLAYMLRSEGSAESIQLALKVEQDLMEAMLMQQLGSAGQNAQAAADVLRLPEGTSLSQLGRNLSKNLDTIITQFQKQESALWDKVPANLPLDISAFMQKIPGIKDKYLLKSENFPSNIRDEIARLINKQEAYDEAQAALRSSSPFSAGSVDERALANQLEMEAAAFQGRPVESMEAEPVTAKEVAKLYSRILTAQRRFTSGADPDREMALALGQAADALRIDLDAADDLAESDVAYGTARAFTRAKADALYRTFIGETQNVNRAGSANIPPDLLPEYLLKGGLNATGLKFRELDSAATEVARKLDELNVSSELRIPLDAIDGGEVDLADLRFNQAQIIRYAAKSILGPDGRIIPDRAALFLEDAANRDILNTFPELEEAIRNGKDFEDTVTLLTKNVDELQKRAESSDVLSMVMDVDNPSTEIAGIMDPSNANPARGLKRLIQGTLKAASDEGVLTDLAGRSIPIDQDGIKNGLKSAFLDYIWTHSGGKSGFKVRPEDPDQFLDYNGALQTVFGPLKKGPVVKKVLPQTAEGQAQTAARESQQMNRQSLAEILVDEGVFSQAEMDRLKFLLEQGQKVQSSLKGKALKEQISTDLTAMTDLALRIGSASTAQSLSRNLGLGGNDLIVGGAGVRAGRNLFEKTPGAFRVNLFQRAVLDPAFMAKLLTKAKTPAEEARRAQFLNAYLINAGLQLADDEEEAGVVPRTTRFEETEVEEIGPVSMAPTLPQVPALPAPLSAPAPSADLLARAPSSPQTAQRMAAAFPNDGILGLMGRG